MRLAKAAHSVFLFTGQLIRSSLGDGANGAGSGAGTAINAGTLVDLANTAGILDGTDGAAQRRQRNGKYRPVTQPV